MIIEPKKSYKQTVKRSYKITHAVLEGDARGTTDLMMTLSGPPVIACKLNAATPQVALDLQFTTGETIALHSRGSDQCSVHLTGYILEDAPAPATASANGKAVASKQKHKDLQKLLEKTMSDEDSDDMDYSALLEGEDTDQSDEDQEDVLGGEEDGDEMGDDSDSEQGEEEDDDEDEDDDDEDDDDDDDAEEESEDDEEEVAQPPPSKKKKESAKQQPEPKQQKAKEQKPDKKEAAQTNGAAAAKGKLATTLAGGVKIKDTKEGTGAFAKPGKNVFVYYEGRVQGKNQIFDSMKQGSGFKFMLGRGTVIKGWDVGVSISRMLLYRLVTNRCP